MTPMREYRRTAALHQNQRLDRGLPFGEAGFLFRQAGDVVAGVPQRVAVGQGDRMIFALGGRRSKRSASSSLEMSSARCDA
jgi:hypothetical protein